MELYFLTAILAEVGLILVIPIVVGFTISKPIAWWVALLLSLIPLIIFVILLLRNNSTNVMSGILGTIGTFAFLYFGSQRKRNLKPKDQSDNQSNIIKLDSGDSNNSNFQTGMLPVSAAICPKCFQEITHDMKSCPRCGYSNIRKTKMKLMGIKKKLLILLSCIVIIMIIVSFIFFTTHVDVRELEKKAASCINSYKYYLRSYSYFTVYEFQYCRKDKTEYLMMYFSDYVEDEERVINYYAVFKDWSTSAFYYYPDHPEKSDRLAAAIIYGNWDHHDSIVLDVLNVMKGIKL